VKTYSILLKGLAYHHPGGNLRNRTAVCVFRPPFYIFSEINAGSSDSVEDFCFASARKPNSSKILSGELLRLTAMTAKTVLASNAPAQVRRSDVGCHRLNTSSIVIFGASRLGYPKRSDTDLISSNRGI
jgi:hypothetical protein